MSLKKSIEKQWYGRITWLWLLLPLAGIFSVLSRLRAKALKRTAQPYQAPVIIVGNISVGGTGKTPLIIALVKYFQALGYTPGVVSRGYGGKATGLTMVGSDSSVSECGDEPVLIFQATGCPVAVSAHRSQAVEALIKNNQCDLIFSDDGLQHYNLYRDIELVVVDASRGFGNAWLLPLGPLRESVSRLADADFILVNGNTQSDQGEGAENCDQASGKINKNVIKTPVSSFHLTPKSWVNITSGRRLSPGEFESQINATPLTNVAVCGIGNPQRFFDSLRQRNIKCDEHAFDDHHQFSRVDFSEWDADNIRVLMTEKDAVKCKTFARASWWALSVEAELPQYFLDQLHTKLLALNNNVNTLNNQQNSESNDTGSDNQKGSDN